MVECWLKVKVGVDATLLWLYTQTLPVKEERSEVKCYRAKKTGCEVHEEDSRTAHRDILKSSASGAPSLPDVYAIPHPR